MAFCTQPVLPLLLTSTLLCALIGDADLFVSADQPGHDEDHLLPDGETD